MNKKITVTDRNVDGPVKEGSIIEWLREKEEIGNQFIQRLAEIVDDYYERQQ
jgi:hypothetical protein